MGDYINYDDELKKMTLLYVEDNEDERKIIVDILKRRLKSVIEAKNGSEALLLYRKYKPDILVTDVMMPVMDGIELIQEVKKLDNDAQIIIASAYDKRTYFIEAINAQVNQFILKPFAQTRLLEALYSCVKHIITERNYRRQQLFIQNILDFQDDIVIVTSGVNIIAANRSFLREFGFKSFEQFKKKGVSICEYFTNKEGSCELDDEWFQNIINDPKTSYEVTNIGKGDKKKIFLVKASEFPTHKKTYILSFTDVTELENEYQKLKWKLSMDSLTKIHNRDTFSRILSGELTEVNKYKHGIALVMVAIKDLTSINEKIGISKADDLLVEVSDLIKSKILHNDILARWFGAEFIIMTFGRDKKVLSKLAVNIKSLLESNKFKNIDKIKVNVDVAIQEEGDDYDTIIKKIENKFEHIHEQK